MSAETSTLQATLGNGPRFRFRDEELVLEARKPLAMLCYLSLAGPSERERLAELLWGADRLLNVRQALYQLRRLPGAQEWLCVGDLVTVRAETDVARFEKAVTDEEYQTALDEWEPPLLAGLVVPRSPAFKEWLELERSRLEALYLRALEARAAELEREGGFEQALALVDRYLAIDPLRESGYRAAMRLNYLLGDAEAAIDRYRACRKMLRDELDSEPLPSTEELAETIVRGQPLSIAVSPGHLAPEPLRLLQALAVAGGGLSVPLLSRVLDRDEFEIAEGIADLQRRLLVESSDGSVPKAVVGETLATIAAPVRRLLHTRIAEAIEAQGEEGRDEEIGLHWLRANRPEAAAPHLLAALRAAHGGHDDQRSAELAFRVLWCGDDRERYGAALLLESLAERQGDGELQDAALEVAGEMAWRLQDDAALARMGLVRGRRLLRRRQPDEARSEVNEALSIARRLDDPTLLAQAVNAIGVVEFYGGRLEEARRFFGENRESGVVDERYRALNNLGAVAGLQGDLAGSYEFLEEALTLARQLGNLEDVGACLNNLAATAERMADYPRAAERFREGRDLARRAGNAVHATQFLLNLAQVHLSRGALGPAWNTALEALDEGEALADLRLVGQAEEQLGQTARVAGDLRLAREHFTVARGHYADSGDERKLATVDCNLAITEYVGGNVGEGRVAAKVERLAELGLSEMSSRFWAELALLAAEERAGRRWLERAREDGSNDHLRLVADLAELRLALVADGKAGEVAKDLEGRLLAIEIVERPIGLVLLAARESGRERERLLERCRQELREQGEGLPRSLRDCHAGHARRWRESLGF